MTAREAQVLENGKRLFGSSGIRGVVGQELTLNFCQQVAQAIATTLTPHSQVCIATDTRISRETLKSAIKFGLLSSGADVTDLGILPTPALAFLTGNMGFDAGIMVTASHNPPEYNGIKLFNRDSIGYSPAQEAEIERVYHEKAFRTGHVGRLGQNLEAKQRYFQFVLDRFQKGNLNHGLRIVVDAGNGAAAGFATELFSLLGLDVIPINDEPDGLFPTRDPEPRKDTLQGTIELTRQHNADLAVCFDGDADRVVFCDREGFLGFNEMIALISRFAVEKTGKRRVTTTVETGRLLDLVLSDLGVEVIRGRVGDVSVAHLCQQSDAAIGVEPVGVYLMPEIGFYPESIYATLTLLSQIDHPEQIRDFFKSFHRLYSAQDKVPCPDSIKTVAMEKVKGNVSVFGACQVNTLDGLRLEFDDSWMLIRPSGTEPMIRISAESNSATATDTLLSQGVQLIEGIVERLTT
jgi:phosphoglucosamine mutase